MNESVTLTPVLVALIGGLCTVLVAWIAKAGGERSRVNQKADPMSNALMEASDRYHRDAALIVETTSANTSALNRLNETIRDAFSIPDDMARLLRRIDRKDGF